MLRQMKMLATLLTGVSIIINTSLLVKTYTYSPMKFASFQRKVLSLPDNLLSPTQDATMGRSTH